MDIEKEENQKNIYPKAWIVTVDMGYGHQRTAYPLKYLAPEQKTINANNYDGIPKKDRRIWESTRKFYEFISNFKRIPVIGTAAFAFFNKFQKIIKFYPRRDLSQATFSLKNIISFIKKGWGKDLISKLKERPIPIITTFFTSAFMAEVFNYPKPIYCVVCDADIARTWAPLNPKESKIKYFAPCNWVVERLKLYGVKEENIFLTGYPLPKENIGTEKMEILREDLNYRFLNLDPKKHFYSDYKPLVDKYLGQLPKKPDHPLTIMFSVGGAGAQKEIVTQYIKSLLKKIKDKEIKIILMAGVRKNVKEYFLYNIKNLGLIDNLNLNVEIVYAENISEYFEIFNQKLRKTDILWTKPSELSFYIGLGVPIIIAPSIGSQEDFNKRWLLGLGAGILSEDPDYADQWIFDYLNSGRFAEAAMQGFIEVEKLGTYKIEKIISQS